MEAFKDSSTGIPIRYRYDGNLFNFRRLQALSKVNETKFRNLLFADDCALNAATEQEMQREVDQFSSAFDDFGLIIDVSTCPRKILPQTTHFSEMTKVTGS